MPTSRLCCGTAYWLEEDTAPEALTPQFLEHARMSLQSYKSVKSLFPPADWNTMLEKVFPNPTRPILHSR